MKKSNKNTVTNKNKLTFQIPFILNKLSQIINYYKNLKFDNNL